MTALPRVVSLLPSATEIAVAVGLGAQLVGRSHECDFPADVADVPVEDACATLEAVMNEQMIAADAHFGFPPTAPGPALTGTEDAA